MKEYKIIEGIIIDCQKLLNQWRHEFSLEILSMNSMDVQGETWVVILLTRERTGVI
jgi:hypothetical protein